MPRSVSAFAVVTLFCSLVLAGCAVGGPESGEASEEGASEENIAETTPSLLASGDCCHAACVDNTSQWFFVGRQPPGGCIDAAKRYCANSGRGPFEDAAWGSCP